MVTKEKLKNYANKLMFDMNEEEYETLLKEFDVIEEQMKLIAEMPNIKDVKPMTFPFDMDYAKYRNDIDTKTVDYKIALSNAKDIENRELKVPKVVE